PVARSAEVSGGRDVACTSVNLNRSLSRTCTAESTGGAGVCGFAIAVGIGRFERGNRSVDGKAVRPREERVNLANPFGEGRGTRLQDVGRLDFEDPSAADGGDVIP